MATINNPAEIANYLHFDFLENTNGFGPYFPRNDAGELIVNFNFQDTLASRNEYSIFDTTGYPQWSALSAAEKDVIRDALAHFEIYLNIDFQEQSGRTPNSSIGFGSADLSSSEYGVGGLSMRYYSAGAIHDYQGQVLIDKDFSLVNGNANGTVSGAHLTMHELGHALGLDHIFSTETGAPAALHNNHYSIMAYDVDPHTGARADTLRPLDILALQQLWGASAANEGDDVYTGAGTADVFTIWDTGGIDTLDASARTNNVVLNLTQGAFSEIAEAGREDVAVAYNTVIENATAGRGNDKIFGNDASNVLRGGDGLDYIAGEGGDDIIFAGDSENDLADRVFAGNGNDSVEGGYGNDNLNGGAGNDTLNGGFGADTVIGNSGNDILTAQAWGDMLYGGAGDDFINGGFGYDRANGGDGADQFFHLGVQGHGSDWIQDYSAAEGDVLAYGGIADVSDFQINYAETRNAGEAGVREAFVIHSGTGQILWALVDGGAQDSINIMIDNETFDLLA